MRIEIEFLLPAIVCVVINVDCIECFANMFESVEKWIA